MAKIGIIAQSFIKSSYLCEKAKELLSGHTLIFLSSDEMDLAEFLQDCSGVIVGREIIDEAILSQLPNLKVITKYGVGLDNIDEASCSRRKIKIFVKPGVNADSAAELTVGLMLSCLRNIALTDRLFHQGVWHKDGGRQLTGKTIGIIGCGEIGSRVARLLKGFSCPLLLRDILPKDALAKETKGKLSSLPDLLQNADIVTVHVPLTQETKGMFSKKEFHLMKKGSYFINTSRGEVVDEGALKIALKSGHLAGAGLDVFAREPVEDQELFKLQNLVATPHIGGNSLEAVNAMGEFAIERFVKFFS